MRWLKNRKPLKPSERIKIVCDRYRHILQIMDTIPEDEAEYTIVLPNDKECSAKLNIYGNILFDIFLNFSLFSVCVFKNPLTSELIIFFCFFWKISLQSLQEW